MTPDKAIKFLDEEIVRLEGAPIINGCEMTDDWRGHLEICKLAKEALEKQIPKKPLFMEGDYDMPLCPNCRLSVDENEHHCICGQALDWSDAE